MDTHPRRQGRHHPDAAGHGHVLLQPKYGNRHGLVAGATGTGKTVTLMTLAEGFSRMGVPVFLADVKGDVAGLAVAGTPSEKLQAARRARSASPTTRPRPARSCSGTCTASSAIRCAPPSARSGPTLLARILELNDTQARRARHRVQARRRPRPAAARPRRPARAARPGRRRAQGHLHVVRPGQHAVDRRDPARAAAPGAGRRRDVLRRAGAGTRRPDAHRPPTAAASSASSPPTS